MNSKKKIHYAWIILFAMCIIRSLSAAGINNTGGLFLKPVAEDLHVGVGNLSIYFSIASLATLLAMPIGGRLFHKYPIKLFLSVATFLLAGSFLLMGFMNHVVAWYILAIPMGIGSAILINLVGPLLINRWFVKDSGKALGILMAAAGFFGIFFQPLTSSFIATQGWRITYIVIGIIIMLLILLTTFLWIHKSPKDKGLQPFGYEQQLQENVNQTIEKQGITFKKARKSVPFYALLIFMITITAFGAFNQHMATYGATLYLTTTQIGSALSVSMIGSTLGAILIGAVSDRFGVFKTTIAILFVIFASILCLYFAPYHPIYYTLGAFFMGLGAMGIPVLSPLLTKSFFGDYDYEIIYSNVMMGPPMATILLLPLYGFIYDMSGSYTMVIYLLAFLIFIGTISILIAKRRIENS